MENKKGKLILESERLRLIPFSGQDRDVLHKMFTDPFIRKFLWDDKIIDLNTATDIINKNDDHFRKDRWGLWSIRLVGSGKLLGFVGLWIFFDESQPQLLYGLYEEFTGNGYATEASSLILRYAFDQLQFHYLTAAMDKPHRPSQQVAKRLEMKLFSEKLIEGRPTLFYKITEEEFKLT